MREDVELEVVVRRGELAEAAQHLVERLRAVDAVERERGHGPQRHRVDQPERAEADPRGFKLLAGVESEQLAVGTDELDRLDLGREARATEPRAMGAGRDRAGKGLAVDVAEVLEREPERIEPPVEFAEDDPGLDLDPARLAVDVEDSSRGDRSWTSTPSVSAISVNE